MSVCNATGRISVGSVCNPLGYSVYFSEVSPTSTGVFDRQVDGRTLQLRYLDDSRFEDTATGSVWTVTRRAVEGPLAGTQLPGIPHGDYFAFAWMVFRPDATLYNAFGL